MIHKTKLTKNEKVKINSDLLILKKLLSLSKKHKFRLVVSGGFGLDGILQTITRPHNDLDVIIYGQANRAQTIKIFSNFFKEQFEKPQISISQNQFLVDIDINAPGFGANIYYVQIINNPFKNLNSIKLQSGKTHVNSEKRFPPPVPAKLNQLKFESQNPNLHLADILFKAKNKPQTKHKQDVKNLKTITDSKFVTSILSLY